MKYRGWLIGPAPIFGAAASELDRGSDHAASGGHKGALPSNTAPANCTGGYRNHRILRAGVDSLYLSFSGQLKGEVEENLIQLKMLAQADEVTTQARAVIMLNGHRFEVRDKGKGRFPYVLLDNWFHLQVSSQEATRLPMVYAQIGSEVLTRCGLLVSVDALHEVIEGLGHLTAKAIVSRADLCVDFVTSESLETIPRRAWVTRSDRYTSHYESNHFSGLTFGLGGDLSCRLYDKTLEIEKSGKTYFHDIWREQGWDGMASVWRLEFQFRRSVLSELGVNIVSDLEGNLAGLWRYATGDWLRLTIPSSTDQTKARWPNRALWDELHAASWDSDLGEPLSRCRKERIPSDNSLFVNGLGAVTSFMAREGIESFDEALQAYGKAAHDFHREHMKKTGKVLSKYAKDKALAKARRFNTAQDGLRRHWGEEE